MKQWKLVLVALLAVLLVCISVTALAEDCEHKETILVDSTLITYKPVAGQETLKHDVLVWQDKVCAKCGKLIEAAAASRVATTQDCTRVSVTTVEKDCTTDEELYIFCTQCGAKTPVVKQEGTALGHKAKNVAEVPATCGKDGVKAYVICERCGKMWDKESGKAIDAPKAIPMIAPAHEYVSLTAEEKDKDGKPASVEATCDTDGYITKKCRFCGDEVKEYKVKTGHNYSDLDWETIKEPSCYEVGYERRVCTICKAAEQIKELPKVGHTYESATKLQNQAPGYEADNIGKVVKAATCTADGTGYLYCKVCNKDGAKEATIPATGHKFGEWTYKPDSKTPTCTEDLVATHVCTNKDLNTGKACTVSENVTIAEKLGHSWQIISGTEATCEEAGKVTRYCPICDTTEKDKEVPATGHDCEWFVIAEPSKEGDGIEELTCINCGEVFDVRTTPYTDMRYGTTITSFGPCTRDLIGGKTWNRVTPIDLSVEGTFTYPLIASNEFTVGTMTVTIKDGKATVSYKLNSTQIKVKSESLVIFNNLEALRAGTGVAAAVNAPVEVAQFEDGKVIIALKLVADYNAVGAGIRDFSADASQIAAMTGIID